MAYQEALARNRKKTRPGLDRLLVSALQRPVVAAIVQRPGHIAVRKGGFMTTTDGKRTEIAVGDTVTNLEGDRKGVVVRLGALGESAQVKWDNREQQLVPLAELKRVSS